LSNPEGRDATDEQAEIRAFLTFGTRTGKLGVTRLDGSPMVVPIWFGVDDDDTLLFTTWGESIKGKSLRRDGRVSLCVDEDSPPYGTCASTARRRCSTIPSCCAAGRHASAAVYMGAERAAEYGARNGVEGELLVRITPTTIVAQAGIAE